MQLKYNGELRQSIIDDWDLEFSTYLMQIKIKQTSIFKHYSVCFGCLFRLRTFSVPLAHCEKGNAFLQRCVENEVKSVSAICISQVVTDYSDGGVE